MKRKFQDKEAISHKMIRANESDRISESSDEISTLKNASDEMIQANESDRISESLDEISTSKNASDKMIQANESDRITESSAEISTSKNANDKMIWANESDRITESSEETSTTESASDKMMRANESDRITESSDEISTSKNASDKMMRANESDRITESSDEISTSKNASEVEARDEIKRALLAAWSRISGEKKVEAKEIKDEIKRALFAAWNKLTEEQKFCKPSLKRSTVMSAVSASSAVNVGASSSRAESFSTSNVNIGDASKFYHEMQRINSAVQRKIDETQKVNVKGMHKLRDEIKRVSLDLCSEIAEKEKKQANESGRISESSEEISTSKNASDFQSSLQRRTVISAGSASSAVNVGASSSRRESFLISNLNSVLNKLSTMCHEDFDVEVAVREISNLNGEMKRIMFVIRSEIERKLKFSKPGDKRTIVMSEIATSLTVNIGSSSSSGESFSTSNLDSVLNNASSLYEDFDIEVALKIFSKLKVEIKRVKLAIRRKIQEDQQVINRRYFFSSVPGG